MPNRKQAEEWLEENSCTLDSGVIAWNERKKKNMATNKTKKNKHISDLTTADLKKKVAQKKVADKKPAKKKDISVDALTNAMIKQSFKIAREDYNKYFKLGMKYAKEFNKLALAKRKELVQNDDQKFGWTDGFVEGALTNMYDGLDSFNHDTLRMR